MIEEEETEMSVSLKEYFDEKFEALEKQLALRDQLTSKALIKADETLNLRLEGMNEFRAQLTQQTHTFVKQSEFKLHIEKVETKIEILTKLVYIGIGILLVLQVVWSFIK
jgi:glucose-6-phosphate isomerase